VNFLQRSIELRGVGWGWEVEIKLTRTTSTLNHRQRATMKKTCKNSISNFEKGAFKDSVVPFTVFYQKAQTDTFLHPSQCEGICFLLELLLQVPVLESSMDCK